MEPPNKGNFGDNMNSLDLFFIERFSFWEAQNVLYTDYTGAINHVLCKEAYNNGVLIWESLLSEVPL